MQIRAHCSVWATGLMTVVGVSLVAQEAPKLAQPVRQIRPSRCMNGPYADFVKQYQNAPARFTDGGDLSIELAITSIEGDEKPVDAEIAKSFGECYQAAYIGTTVSTKGVTYSFVNDNSAMRGGGPGQLPPEVMRQLQPLLDPLPDDGGRLPPPGDKVIVQVSRSGFTTVRVYDRARLPDKILEMVRLTQARVRILTPLFQPAKQWPAEQAQSLGLTQPRAVRGPIIVSPDGTTKVVHSFVGHKLEVYVGDGKADNSYGVTGKEVRDVPEFWQTGQEDGGGYMTRGLFSPDGRFLLIEWGKQQGCVLYDTTNWEPVRDANLFPQGLSVYMPSPDWSLGLAVSTSGEVFIWDSQNRRMLSKLDGMADVQSIAFSPDATKIAIFSGPNDVYKFRLSVWDIRDGRKLSEFWPAKWLSFPNGKPVWWNGG